MRHSTIRPRPANDGNTESVYVFGGSLAEEAVRMDLADEWARIMAWAERNGVDAVRDVSVEDFLEAAKSLQPEDIYGHEVHESPVQQPMRGDEHPTFHKALPPPPMREAV